MYVNTLPKRMAMILVMPALFITSDALSKPELIIDGESPLIISLGAVTSDNLNPTFDSNDDAWGGRLKLSGQLTSLGEGTRFLMDYETTVTNWRADEDNQLYDGDNTMANVRVRGLGRFFLSDQWQVDIEAQHHRVDEPFGTGLSRLRKNIEFPDNRQINSAMITAAYGQDLVERYITLSAGVRDRTYDDINGYGPRFDALETIFTGEVGFAVSPATQFLVNVGVTEYDFKQTLLEDSQVYRAVFGISWLPSAASTLRAVAGGFYRTFDVQESRSSFLWDVLYQWKPNNRFTLIFDSRRDASASENELSSDSVLSDTGLYMAYRYSVRWSTSLRLGHKKTEYDDTNGDQDLTEQHMSAKLIFSFSSFQSINLEYQWKNMSTKDDFIDYEQNQIGINWQYEF